MAADQRRKRLNGASIVGYGSRDQHRAKRKNLGAVQNDLNMKSHISVEWDGSQKRVVAKREQVGISWRQMKPFVNFVPNGHNVLADAFSIPQEIFDLDDLNEVLSYKVWKTHLSENERNMLMHFLPRGSEPHQVVQELLAGDNFHFGSPFLKWGALLGSGDLHPDTIVKREEHLKSEKRAYYSELRRYHEDMVENLMKMKETWESCRDSEREFLQKIWRSNNEIEKKKFSNVKASRVYDHDEYVTATSESSWAAEEKACSSDNQISSGRKGDKLQKRVFDKGSVKGKPGNVVIASDDMMNVGAGPNKGDKVLKRNIHSSDGQKYMSCIMISKKQHELVKSMKQSGKSIQSRSLNRVLGNLDNIHVQPYEVFIKEEQKKLHEHWLQVVNKDLPAAYVNWSERQTQRQALLNSLVVEIKDKWKTQLEDKDNANLGNKLQDEEDDGVIFQDREDDSSMLEDQESDGGMHEDQESDGDLLHDQEGDGDMLQDQEGDGGVVQDQGDDGGVVQDQEDDGSMLQDQEDDGPVLQDQEDDGPMLQDQEDDGVINNQSSSEDSQEDEDSVAKLPSNQPPHDSYSGDKDQFNPLSMDSGKNLVLSKLDDAPRNQPPCDSYHGDENQFDHMSMDSGKNLVLSKLDDAPRSKTEYLTNMNTQDAISEGVPFSSGGDVWQAVEMPHSYYDPTVTHGYTASGMSIGNPQTNEGQRTRLMDLESDLHQEETTKELLHRQTDNGSFGSYLNQNRSDLLQSLFKGEGMLSYHHNQKGAGSDFQTSNNVMLGDGQFPGHFKEPLQTSLTLDQGQRRSTGVYMPENMSNNIYSDENRYLIPRQDSLPAVNMNDWAATATRIPAPSHSHLNTGEFIGQHWFPADQVRGGWNGSDGASLSSLGLGTGMNSDQSLFSVLSQCTQLRSNSPYDSARHTDQFLSSRTYGVVDAAPPRINAVVPQVSHPLDYMNGRDVPNSLVPDDMGWMGLPHQNSALHDQMGKPYLRSWNR
ncbi:hypothetical protein L6164_009118 [Bauhinia variegata]|uniref:Uncharacterized protein n=1 Tax=Bauhinia variegata TaxID=167791 RepID=A0ACB9PHP6_BAUVA|nr:hypothetical protein L6164_009118 [Bauhinia variegata]